MLEFKSFITPMLNPSKITVNGLSIYKYSSIYKEFCCIRLKGSLDSQIKLKFNKTAIIANNSAEHGLCCRFENFQSQNNQQDNSFKLEALKTALVIEGTVSCFEKGEFDCYICVENFDDNIVLLL